MARKNMAMGPAFAPDFLAVGPQAAAILLALAALPALAIALLVPPSLILPALCFVSLANAGAIALFAWFSGVQRDAERVTLWDVAGICLFVAFAAGMLSEAEHVAQLFGLISTAP